jgi:hypothetical protein
MATKTLERLRLEVTLPDLCLHPTNEVLCQAGDIVRPDAEWRDVYDEAMDSIVEIGAETTLANHRSQVPMRRAQQANVDTPRRFTADPSNVPSLQDAEQSCLKIRRQLSHFVQEERPAVCLLERASVRLHRAGERPPLVAEELALDELTRKAPAVQRHERTIVPPPSFVKRARDVLLANARFTMDQDGPRQIGKSIDIGHDG